MRNTKKIVLGICLIFAFTLILPTSLAFTETDILQSALTSSTRSIPEHVHQGRIQFSFIANDTLTTQITDCDVIQVLWSVTATNGSCDLDVNKSELYRIRFIKSPGYVIYIQYTVVEQGGIPGFTLVYSMFLILALVGLIYLKKYRSF